MNRILLFSLLALSISCNAGSRQVRNTTAPRWQPLPKFMVPKSAGNIALNKPVKTSSEPEVSSASMITNGDKEGTEGHWVQLGDGLQWVQIDLGRRSRIYGLHLWHYFLESNVHRDVIVQVCDENTFTQSVRTIYNNDHDNTSGFGKGLQREFYEHHTGFRIDTRGKNYEGSVARFVRFYSNGTDFDRINRYIEIEIIGEPYHPNRNLVLWKPYVPPADYNSSGPRKPDSWKRKLKPLPDFWVPRGARVISKGKQVNSSDDFPIIGTLSMVTDGVKESYDGGWVELGPGPQWVQIDLLQPCAIYGLHIWHYYGESRIYWDVIVQVSADADFIKNVRTLFNNDNDNSSDLGKGNDKEYYETNLGYLLNVTGPHMQGVKARFVRLYSKGNTSDPQNHYTEVEIIGQQAPVKLASAKLQLKEWKTAYPAATYN